MLDSRLKAASFPTILRGSKADVRMSPGEEAMYREAIDGNDKISIQRRTHLNRFFKEFCENDDYWKRLNPEQFKQEGKFTDGNEGGNLVAVWTFKAWQWRVYGAILTVEKRRCFVGVRVDPSKKQNKADRQLLEATAKLIGALSEYHE